MNVTRVSTPTEGMTDAGAAASPRGELGVGREVWHFARHYLEMCAAMCIGGVILNALVFVVGPALIGYPDPRERAPGLSLVISAFLFTLPMAAWMLVRGMAWRPTLEMSGATVGSAILVVALAGIGIVPRSSLDAWLDVSCMPWCVAMLVAMLFRLPLYTGRTGHERGRA